MSKNLFHAGDVAICNAVSTPHNILAFFYKMHIGKVADKMKRTFVHLLVDMYEDIAMRIRQTFCQAEDLFRALESNDKVGYFKQDTNFRE